jgi:hypothetical protein
MKLIQFFCLVGVVIFLIGCSGGPSRLSPPSVNSGAGQAALEKYDANKDGSLSADELAKSPGLRIATARIDTNNDRLLSADEINGRITKWRESRLALSSMNARVRLNGAPLQNATITLVPDDILGPAVKTAIGTTDADGFATVVVSSDPDENGVHLGFYRIEISKKVKDKETIPARYNEKSELGVEVAHDVLDTQNFAIELRGG